MTKYYLSEDIFIDLSNKKYYYEDIDNNIIKLNNKNWFKYLSNYNWSRLSIQWRKRLKENNKSCFGLLDCGSNGDCLFHVISEALNSKLILENKDPIYDYQILRNIASNEINDDNFEYILDSYKCEKQNNEFMGDWDPFEIDSINDLREEINKCGDNFWGDHILLQLIQKKLDFNTIIFSSNYLFDEFKILPLSNPNLNNNKKTILIHYLDMVHFQLLGYFDGNKMTTLFDYNNIPNIVLDIYNEDCRN